MRFTLTLVGTLFTMNVLAHPLHVSICEVEYNKENEALEIVLSMFIDEMESAVLLKHGQRLKFRHGNSIYKNRQFNTIVFI